MLLNKVDLPPRVTIEGVREHFPGDVPILALSVLDPGDIKNLRSFLTETFLRNPLELGHSTMIPNLRHKECLERTLESLRRARELVRTQAYGELVSFEFTVARQFLESILGRAPNDGLLDRIFSEFCIGK
jgi:tRNA modification GTPase